MYVCGRKDDGYFNSLCSIYRKISAPTSNFPYDFRKYEFIIANLQERRTSYHGWHVPKILIKKNPCTRCRHTQRHNFSAILPERFRTFDAPFIIMYYFLSSILRHTECRVWQRCCCVFERRSHKMPNTTSCHVCSGDGGHRIRDVSLCRNNKFRLMTFMHSLHVCANAAYDVRCEILKSTSLILRENVGINDGCWLSGD